MPKNRAMSPPEASPRPPFSKQGKRLMASNHKLTALLKGRTLAGTSQADGAMLLTFTDGSIMTIQTAPTSSNSASTGGTIKAVRQQDTRLDLDFDDGSTLEITTAEATSSVMVRDKNHVMEYAD